MQRPLTMCLLFQCVAVAACNDAVDLNAATSAAFISGNAMLDQSCRPQTDRWLGVGTFDISQRQRGGGCPQPYLMHLIVDSQSDELALFDQAEVSLEDPSSGALVGFNSTPEVLSNPYKVLAAGRMKGGEGLVPVQVIPNDYAKQLRAFENKSIGVEVRLSGSTQSGRPIKTQTFRFPLSICDGCLTVCSSDIPEGATEQDIYGNDCVDNAGADGRVCVNAGC